MKHPFVRATVWGGLVLAGAAQAQSSVTLYGVADLALGHVTGSRTQLYGAAPQTNGSSRWGLRGREDLGAGQRVDFNFESEVRLTDGSGGGTGGASSFARAANLSWTTPVGSLRLGRTLSPSYYAFTVWDLTQAANYNVVSSQFSYAGLGSRNSAEISVSTPVMAGLQATLGHVLAANNGQVAKNEFTLAYRQGPLAASLAYNKLDNTPKNLSLGAAYDLGAWRVAASLHDARGGGRGKGYTLGARYTTGPWSLTADLARDTTKHDTDALLEARYALSKRSFVYAAYVHNGQGKAARTVNTQLLGFRHNF